MYDFDKIINRYNTSSEKYDARFPKDADNNLLPMRVADMDFRTADPVLDAICKYTKHGIFGYVHAPDSLYDSIDNWFLQNHGLTVKREHVVHTPGVVFAIVVAIRAFTEIGDAVMIQQPVYYPFAGSIINNGRKLVNSPLIRTDHGYVIDLDDFEKKIVENNVKMFLLCSLDRKSVV